MKSKGFQVTNGDDPDFFCQSVPVGPEGMKTASPEASEAQGEGGARALSATFSNWRYSAKLLRRPNSPYTLP